MATGEEPEEIPGHDPAKTRRTNGQSLKVIIEDVNRTLKGWFEYFKHSGKTTFPDEDGWIRGRLRSLLRKRSKR